MIPLLLTSDDPPCIPSEGMISRGSFADRYPSVDEIGPGVFVISQGLFEMGHFEGREVTTVHVTGPLPSRVPSSPLQEP